MVDPEEEKRGQDFSTDISGHPIAGAMSSGGPNARIVVQWLLENQEKNSSDFDAWLAGMREDGKKNAASSRPSGTPMFMRGGT